MIGTVYVVILFLLFIIQWEIKRKWLIRKAGIDPDVFGKSSVPLQQFMNKFQFVMTGYIIILIICHGLGIQWYSFFSMFDLMDFEIFDHGGFVAGISGLAIALYSQIKMGKSWRVGIDEKNPPDLITTGLYRFIRNPTYVGVIMLVFGVWVIWPTWSIGIFCLIFYFFIEVQVRSEEEYLIKIHNEVYRNYLHQTKRYIPFVY